MTSQTSQTSQTSAYDVGRRLDRWEREAQRAARVRAAVRYEAQRRALASALDRAAAA